MVSIVFNFKYLSQNFINLSIQGVFWNPEDKQISKLSLGNKYDQDLRQQTEKQGFAHNLVGIILNFDFSRWRSLKQLGLCAWHLCLWLST